jgi:hypothetical protein
MIGLLELLAIILLALLAGAIALYARSTVDGPDLVLTTAVRHFPPQRAEWATAMTSEMAQLTRPVQRWRFAFSAARMALFPPGHRRLAPAIAIVLTALTATATGVATGRALPGLRVFAIALVAALGLSIALTLYRRGARPAVPWFTLSAPLLLGVAGCVATAGYVIATYPAAGPVVPGEDLSTSDTLSVVFGLMLAAYAWLAFAPPRTLADDRRAVRIGSLAALLLAAVLAVESLSGIAYDSAGYAVPATLVIFPLAAALGATVSLSAGLRAAWWAGALSAPAFAAIATMGALRTIRGGTDADLLGEFARSEAADLPTYQTYAISEHLGGAVLMLAVLPVWALLLGLISSVSVRSLRATTIGG